MKRAPTTIAPRLGAVVLAAAGALAAGCADAPVHDGGVAAAPAALVVAPAPVPAPAEAAAPAATRPGAAATEEDAALHSLGIRIVAVRLSAGGYMLDLRYRLVDPERARPLFERKQVLFLEDVASGARLTVPGTPKLGPLRPGKRAIKVDHDYAILFANPGAFVQRGARVRLVAGDVRVAALTVQ